MYAPNFGKFGKEIGSDAFNIFAKELNAVLESSGKPTVTIHLTNKNELEAKLELSAKQSQSHKIR